MHPNRGRINYDSISSSAPYDLYAVIRNPNAPKPPLKNSMDTLEKIETIQSRLEKEAMEKLQGSYLKLPNEKFVVVARVGKFVFIALTLPPYILLYSVPKWVLLEAFPLLFTFAKNGLHKMQKTLLQNWMAQKLAGLKEGMGAVGKKVGEYFSWINRTAKALFAHLTHPFVALAQRLMRPLQEASDYARMRKEALQKNFAKLNEKLRSIQKWPSSLAAMFNEGRQRISKFLDGAKEFFQKLGKNIHVKNLIPEEFAQRLAEGMLRLKSVLGKGKDFAKKATRFGSEKTKALFSPLKEWADPYFNAAAALLKKQMHKWSDKAARKIEEVQEKTVKLYQAAAQPIVDMGLAMVQFFTPMIVFMNPKPLWQRFRQKSADSFGKRRQQFQQKLQVIKSILKNSGQLVVEFIKKVRIEFIRLLKKALAWLWKEIKTVPGKLWKGIKSMYKMGVRMFKILVQIGRSLFFGLRVLYAWARVLIRYGLQLDRKITTEIAHWSHLDEMFKKASKN